MKFIISLILMVLLSFVACLYLPWWSIAIVCFVVAALIRQRPLAAFITGFVSLFLLWGGLSFWISNNNSDLLAHKISMLILKVDNPSLLILFTAFVGAIVGAFSALTGSFFSGTKSIGK